VLVEYDGAYWHGLDRPVEVIAASHVPRDQSILRRFYDDIRKYEWIERLGEKFVRIVEGTEEEMSDSELIDLLTR
jgi:hypothetical protein